VVVVGLLVGCRFLVLLRVTDGSIFVKLVNYRSEGGMRVGLVRGDLVFDLEASSAALGFGHTSLRDIDEVLAEGVLEELVKAGKKLSSLEGGEPIANVKVLAPVQRPEKILCVAVNYVSHGKEQSVTPPTEPYFFTKFRNAIVGPGDDILIPKVSKKVDWEVELAVIIKKEGKYIPKESAMDYVAGYTVANDVSFRDLQFPAGWPDKPNPLGLDWVKGKSLDGAFPLGPWLVTRDEIRDPHNLRISLKVNGNTKQDSTTAEMVVKIDRLIESASNGITLRPGDVISTGTPLGVAIFSGQPYLKPGDVVESTIEGIGTLTNGVRSD
jgi:2-keto-4-pentenoate hydratase/2-oxohepta-3-ene-1,7-dioic acid hydratase in catechol pathway